jgi:hypothetical protein
VQNSRIACWVLAGAFLAPIPAAMAQSTNIAYAAAPRADYVVFLDSGATLSPMASYMVQKAARAAKSAKTIEITGRADYAEAVKTEMLRNGVAANAIVVTPKVDSPLPKAKDGLKDPLTRRVEISF